MTNGVSDYRDLYDASQVTAGGAASVFTIDPLPLGDALDGLNFQDNGFQMGIDVTPSTVPFVIHTRILSPFAGVVPEGDQSMGVFFGTGAPDNYAKLVVSVDGGLGAIQTGNEISGSFVMTASDPIALRGVVACSGGMLG